MTRGPIDADRYRSLRQTGAALARLAPLVTMGIWILGIGRFLDQARDLLSDAQFTWGERQVMAVIAVVTIGGSLLAGWVIGRLLKAGSDLINVLADLGDSSWRTNELLEKHVIPLLGRIASGEGPNVSSPSRPKETRSSRAETDRESPRK